MAVKIITMLTLLQLLTGCFIVPHILYKIDVQQGNVVTEEMVEKLKPDMTKSQVRFVMGSPLIVDPFRKNRWDYAYIQRLKGDLEEQKKLTIFFNEDDRLINYEIQEIYPRRGKKKDSDAEKVADSPPEEADAAHDIETQ